MVNSKFVCVAVFAVGALSGSALADQGEVNTCSSQPPDVSKSFARGVTTINVTSPNASYASPTCNSYVADIVVPIGVKGTLTIWDGATQLLSVSQADCAATAIYESVYKKSAPLSPQFKKVGGGAMTGKWIENGTLGTGCYPQYDPAQTWAGTFHPAGATTDTYRVVRRVTRNGQTQPVSVRAKLVPPAS